MNITEYNLHSQNELFDVIRNTHLLGNNNIFPFKNANLSIRTVSYRDLIPTQAFVFREQLSKIHEIYTQMMHHGINLFFQQGFMSYKIDRLN